MVGDVIVEGAVVTAAGAVVSESPRAVIDVAGAVVSASLVLLFTLNSLIIA